MPEASCAMRTKVLPQNLPMDSHLLASVRATEYQVLDCW